MRTVKFADVRSNIIESMRKRMLIPIIGSGFTRGCNSLYGTVPSGEDYRNYMIKAIESTGTLKPDENKVLQSETFSAISSVYHAEVPVEKQHKYLKDHFTKVSIEPYKKNLLSLQWPYIYTLNIDDAIERNSAFRTVIYSNRRVRKDIFDDNKCVIKLHGDITEMLSYEDTVSEIFDQAQYVTSLHKNASLLSRLTHDFLYQNLLYIGCSLSDEIDLLSVSANSTPSENARFFCTVKIPSRLEEIKLESYKITHCVVFESYQEIYDLIYEAALEAEKIEPKEIDYYQTYKFTNLKEEFNPNKSYLFHGKSLINKDRSITLPYFFISRDVTDEVIQNIDTYSIQFLLGGGCSGKTYIGIDVARRIRDRDVFVFTSKECLGDDALNSLLGRGNCLIIADSNTLNIRQIERLIKSKNRLKKLSISIIIIENKNNRDLAGLIRLLELNDIIEPNSIPQIEISNKFSKEEIAKLNERLVTATFGVFSENRTIADNIIESSHKLIEKNRFDSIVPHFDSERKVACLIALATENKVYSSRVVELDLMPEVYEQERASRPLIEIESTWAFEKSTANNSPTKYVVNAKYWLYNQLSAFAKEKKNHVPIINAYRRIISRLIEIYGKPSLLYGDKYAQYKPYILFDNINEIFKVQGLALIRGIYENLNDLLSSDPNYMHQRAKCYIKSASFEREAPNKMMYLKKAYRDANVAHSVFEKRYEDTGNEKTLISIAHVEYTKALVLCHQANVNSYQDGSQNTNAVKLLHNALCSPYNSYDFAKSDTYNYGNVVLNLVTELIASKSLVDESVHEQLDELFMLIKACTTIQ